MGRELAPVVAARFGKAILELGGNNAMIVAPSAKLELAVRAILFAAVGTAGQRCTSLRRLFVHESIYDTLVRALKAAYAKLNIGDPLAAGTLVGPLIDKRRVRGDGTRARVGEGRRRQGHRRRAGARGEISQRVLRASGDRRR